MIAIVTDSTCDIPADHPGRADIHVVPALVTIGQQTLRDELDISRDTFYNMLPTLPAIPTTSSPGRRLGSSARSTTPSRPEGSRPEPRTGPDRRNRRSGATSAARRACVARKQVEMSDFAQLVERESRGLVAAVTVIVGDPHRAEEIVQDAFDRCYRRWRRVSQLDRPGAWVRRVAINAAISSRRRSTSERRAVERLGGRAETARQSGDPQDAFGDAALWAEVRALPGEQAAAIAPGITPSPRPAR